VLIVGTGAIGGTLAARMTGAVRRVVALDANREHVERLRDPGLTLERSGESREVKLEAYTSVDEVDGEFDFVLIAVKAPAIEAALEPLAARDMVETYVSLGNGVVYDRISAIVGPERLVVGTVELGATNLGPGHVRQTTINPFVIGELDGSIRDRTRALARVLEPVEEVRITDNIRGQLWSKLLVNSSLSGLGVVGGCTYGEVAAHPEGRQAIFEVWSEGHQIGMAQGLSLEAVLGTPPERLASTDEHERTAALETVVQHAGATRASMLQDVERGARTEVDVINGGVVSTARKIGASAPLNAAIVEIVQGFERGESSPSTDLFARVRRAGSGESVAPSGAPLGG
jgi:2-dehydropantoate 2-reductase